MQCCELCEQKNVDGALNQHGTYICVDCWADGSAKAEGYVALEFVGANVSYPVFYPADMIEKTLEGYNR